MNDASTLSQKSTILVVDDTPQNLSLIGGLLETDYTVRLANGGARALKIAQGEARPDLILLDIVMPDMDGFEVCRQLKENPLSAAIPVIFLTAKTAIEDEEMGFQLGAVDYITKPISPPRVLARVRAHLALKQASDLLEKRNRDDKKKFEQTLAQQMEINTLRSTFVAMTTHEFRTPLTSLLSSQELLRHYSHKLDAVERERIFVDMESAVTRMSKMLEQVMTIGRADTNMLGFEPKDMDLAAFCRQLTIEAAGGQDAPSNVALEFDLRTEIVVADEKLLRHILGNLLSNAIKYSPKDACVAFKVRGVAQSIAFEITDQGIGIPADDLPRLFGNFQRASNVGEIAGTGLGLAIAKRAVDSHRGTISVESQPGKGSTFTVIIPQG